MRITYKLFFYCVILLLLGSGAYGLYTYNTESLNFRTGNDKIAYTRIFDKGCYVQEVNHKNAPINMSGSSYLNLDHLQALFKSKGISPEKVYIFDVLPTTHYMVNNRPIEWYGYSVKNGELRSLEIHKNNIFSFLYKKYILWLNDPLENMTVDQLVSEEDTIKSLGWNYVKPLPKEWVEDWSFLEDWLPIFQKIPKDGWAHFHCLRGRGRTTSAMAYYDIFRNHDKMTVEDIIKRQYCIGGEYLDDITVWKSSTWPQERLVLRRDILYYFYDYMNDPQGYKKTPWTKWLKEHKKT
ncbi:MAG: hypothetical protein KBF71_06410 [Alphaproteobacteria bacterium]|jgi:hypothetical protein|nr:hypothetical protein [Alphaproteobacteria bacterium]